MRPKILLPASRHQLFARTHSLQSSRGRNEWMTSVNVRHGHSLISGPDWGSPSRHTESGLTDPCCPVKFYHFDVPKSSPITCRSGPVQSQSVSPRRSQQNMGSCSDEDQLGGGRRMTPNRPNRPPRVQVGRGQPRVGKVHQGPRWRICCINCDYRREGRANMHW